MATYLLLRNNKESGPYSLQQLQQMGLKPYDLVWVEGRSAAWRYPGEVNELKEFAPSVEEQPYDRFYKKPGENKEKHFYEMVEEKAQKDTAPKVNMVNTTNEKINSKVYVSMPVRPISVTQRPVENKIPATPVLQPAPVKEYKKEPDYLTEKYSQPLDEIKKRYVETYLKRKQKISWNKKMKATVKLSTIAVIVFGMAAILYIKFKPREKDPVASNTNPVSDQVISTEANPGVENTMKSRKQNIASKNGSVPIAKTNNTAPFEKKKNITEEKTTAEKNETENETLKINSQQTVEEGQREKSVRDDAANKKINPASLTNYVSVKANEYKRRNFGGIENLQLTVINSSNYTLDKVTVELQYLKPSELPLKIENIFFSGIAPNGSMTIKIPDSPRGIKVAYKVIQVESGQFDKNTAGL